MSCYKGVFCLLATESQHNERVNAIVCKKINKFTVLTSLETSLPIFQKCLQSFHEKHGELLNLRPEDASLTLVRTIFVMNLISDANIPQN